jgi:NADH dehydrogenase/NADH:ubiquinone oxidoreductase subunit G
MPTLLIDKNKFEADAGTNLLKACLENDIYIPNLCHLEGMPHPPASCRLCFVEIEGHDDPVPACTLRVNADMVIQTGTPRVRRLQKSALQLLLSVHHVDCKNCPANRKCALQEMAKFLKTALKSKHLDLFLKEIQVDQNHPFLDYYPNRCVLCGRCVHVCRDQQDIPELTFAKRGFNTVISYFGNLASPPPACDTCRACAEVCPVAALVPRQ